MAFDQVKMMNNLRKAQNELKKEIIEVLKNKKKIIVLDKSLTLSGQNSGHLYEEVRSALYGVNKKIDIFGKTVGLGGKPIYPDDLRKIIIHHE